MIEVRKKTKDDNPAVSVVMSVFNGEKYLAEAICSILTQSFRHFELIIIDDGSVDGTASILEDFQNRDPRVQVLQQENRGLVSALNRGCSIATGKYIARMDADDMAMPDRLNLQLQFMEANPSVGVVGGNVEFMNSEGEPLGFISDFPNSNEEIQKALLQTCVIWHPTAFFRRSIFLASGGYRTIKDAEDYDLWLRFAEQSQLANLPTMLLRYRFHKSQISTSNRGRQVLAAVAAQASALARRSGKPDPLEQSQEISLQSVRSMGVSEKTIQTAVARGYLTWIQKACGFKEYTLALEMFATMCPDQFGEVERWIVANSYLEASVACWHLGRHAQSATTFAKSLMIRPATVGRILKLFIQRTMS